MPNTGMINNHTYKCEKCKQNFREIWSPSNICCRIAELERDRVSSAYSRYASLRPTKERIRRELERQRSNSENPMLTRIDGTEKLQRNKLAPFSTLEKPTCGFNFSRETDNRKKNFGILPSNLVKWRSQKIEKVSLQ